MRLHKKVYWARPLSISSMITFVVIFWVTWYHLKVILQQNQELDCNNYSCKVATKMQIALTDNIHAAHSRVILEERKQDTCASSVFHFFYSIHWWSINTQWHNVFSQQYKSSSIYHHSSLYLCSGTYRHENLGANNNKTSHNITMCSKFRTKGFTDNHMQIQVDALRYNGDVQQSRKPQQMSKSVNDITCMEMLSSLWSIYPNIQTTFLLKRSLLNLGVTHWSYHIHFTYAASGP